MKLKSNLLLVILMLFASTSCSKKAIIDVHLFGKKLGCSTCFVANDVNYDYLTGDLEDKITSYGTDLKGGIETYKDSLNPANVPEGYVDDFKTDYGLDSFEPQISPASHSGTFGIRSLKKPTRQFLRSELIQLLKANESKFGTAGLCTTDILNDSFIQKYFNESMIANFTAEEEVYYGKAFQGLAIDCEFFQQKGKLGGLDVHFSYFEILALRQNNQIELKEYKNLNTSNVASNPVTEEQLTTYKKKKARREFLQVFTNAVMANATNLFAFLNYAMLNDTLFKDNEGLESFFKSLGFNTTDLSNTYATNRLQTLPKQKLIESVVKPNKPAFYLFLEKVILEESMVYDEAAQKITYKIEPSSLCKVISGDASKNVSNGAQVAVEQMNDCMRFVSYYLQKVSIIQDINHKKIDLNYYDSTRMSKSANFLTASYTYNYESTIALDLNDYQRIVVAFTENELSLGDDDKTIRIKPEDKLGTLDTEDIKYLKSLAVAGKISLKNYVETEKNAIDKDEPNKIFDVVDLTLKSYTKIDITNDLYFKVPDGTASTRGYYDYLLTTGSSQITDMNKEGEIEVKLPARPNFVRIDHTRDTTLYGDALTFDLNYLDVKFPPYKFTSTELLSFGASFYPICPTANCQNAIRINKQAVKDSSKIARATYIELAKDSPDFDKINFAMTGLDLDIFTILRTDQSTTPPKVERVIDGMALSQSMIHVDTDLNLKTSSVVNNLLSEIPPPNSQNKYSNIDVTFNTKGRFQSRAVYAPGSSSPTYYSDRNSINNLSVDVKPLEVIHTPEGGGVPETKTIYACGLPIIPADFDKPEFAGQANPETEIDLSLLFTVPLSAIFSTDKGEVGHDIYICNSI